jgi:hypothetical protein
MTGFDGVSLVNFPDTDQQRRLAFKQKPMILVLLAKQKAGTLVKCDG